MVRKGNLPRPIETRNDASKMATFDHAANGNGLPWYIEMVPPQRLRPASRNARTHSKKQIHEIANSMRRFGVINPIVTDSQGRIIAGHARAEAAKILGLRAVPVIRISHLTETELRAYTLADNKLATRAGWDRELLAIELSELQIDLPKIDLDIGITGFDPGEVDSLIVDFEESQSEVDGISEVDASSTAARSGDLFELGGHRLIVGDARDSGTFELLMQGHLAEMAFLDPPYNVPIAGHVGGRGRIKHREFAVASGEMSSGQFIQFLTLQLPFLKVSESMDDHDSAIVGAVSVD